MFRFASRFLIQSRQCQRKPARAPQRKQDYLLEPDSKSYISKALSPHTRVSGHVLVFTLRIRRGGEGGGIGRGDGEGGAGGGGGGGGGGRRGGGGGRWLRPCFTHTHTPNQNPAIYGVFLPAYTRCRRRMSDVRQDEALSQVFMTLANHAQNPAICSILPLLCNMLQEDVSCSAARAAVTSVRAMLQACPKPCYV